MSSGTKPGVRVVALALPLAACAPTLHPETRQSAALPVGARTIALAPALTDIAPAMVPDRAAVERALADAGFALRPSPADARYLLVVTVAEAPRRVGTLLPPEEGAPSAPVRWIARPPHGLRARFGPPAAIRVGAVLADAATGREMWRGSLATGRRPDPQQATRLAARLLAELPRDQGTSAGGS